MTDGANQPGNGHGTAGAGRHDGLVQRLLTTVLSKAGTMDPAAREAAAAGDPSGPYASYTRKVRDASHTVTDADVAKLKAAGLSEEQIFELTVSAALGAAHERLKAARKAARGGP